MSAVLLGVHEPNTEPWYELRAGGIGASEIAAVVGLSPYVSAFWLWHFKKGNIPGQSLSSAMDWGHRLEPVVRDWFAERHPEFATVPTPGTYAHAERTWQRCNPDGLIFDRADDDHIDTRNRVALYEGKTARYPDGWGPSGTDEIPLHYRCQIQQSLDIFGLPRAYLAVLIGGNEPREYVIEADPEDQATLREAGAAFWESLQNDTEPPIDASDSTYQAVRQLNPEIDPELEVEPDPNLYAEYLTSKTNADAANERHQKAKSELLAAMGNARRLLYFGRPVLRRQPSRNGVALYPIKEAS